MFSQDVSHVLGRSKEKEPKEEKKRDNFKGHSKTPKKSIVNFWSCEKEDI